MFQVNFSEQSMFELNQLDTRSQMMLVEVISTLKQEQLDNPNEVIGRFNPLVWNPVVAIFLSPDRTLVCLHNHEADQTLEGSNYEMRQMPAHLAQHYF